MRRIAVATYVTNERRSQKAKEPRPEGLRLFWVAPSLLTPHLASYLGHIDVVELLLAKGADVNAKGRDGFTPLHAAITDGHPDVADLLRQHGGHE